MSEAAVCATQRLRGYELLESLRLDIQMVLLPRQPNQPTATLDHHLKPALSNPSAPLSLSFFNPNSSFMHSGTKPALPRCIAGIH